MSSKTDEFLATIDNANELIPWGSSWRHYKGGIYAVDSISIDTDNLEARIEYHRISGPDFDYIKETDIRFSRPLSQWFDMVEVEGLGAPMIVQRFVKVKPRQVTQWVEA